MGGGWVLIWKTEVCFTKELSLNTKKIWKFEKTAFDYIFIIIKLQKSELEYIC